MAQNTKIITVSIEPKRLKRLNELCEVLGLSRSGFLARLVDHEWERYTLTEAGRQALEQQRNETPPVA